MFKAILIERDSESYRATLDESSRCAAAGGVGSIAVALLSTPGFRVAAVTGRRAESDFLKQSSIRNGR
jgi:hypothetical protein